MRFSFRFWLLVVATGVGAGFTSGLLMKLLRLVQHLAFGYQSEPFLRGVQQASGERRVLALLAAGVVGGAGLYLLRRFTGQGGQDLSETIWCKEGKLPLVQTALRAVLSITLVGMGAAVGRETALKQAGGIVAGSLSATFRLSAEDRRLLVASGIGAGMAAAYNVPLGGAVFTLEVLLGSFSLPFVLVAVITSFIAVYTSYLFLPDAPTYSMPVVQMSNSLIVWSVLAGLVTGVFSAIYIRTIRWATTGKRKGLQILVAPIAVLGLLGAISLQFPEVLGNGKNVVQLTLGNPLPIGLLLLLLVLRPLATALCFRSGIQGGLFTPTMTFGALLGSVLSWAWKFVWPGPQPAVQAILISGAVLAASSQGPISAVVFILELTRRLDGLMLPLLIAVGTATLVCRRFESASIYSVKVEPC